MKKTKESLSKLEQFVEEICSKHADHNHSMIKESYVVVLNNDFKPSKLGFIEMSKLTIDAKKFCYKIFLEYFPDGELI